MKNFRLAEFIIKYEKFYKLLSKHNKSLISNLDLYGDLGLYYCKGTGSTFYLYIGKKSNKYYFCKFENTVFNDYDITNSNIIIAEKIDDFLQCFIVNKIDKWDLDRMV